jgi:translation initiation factor IF-3
MKFAEERGLDLVEVAPEARPPVCRIMDYGRYKYEKKRKDKESRKKQHVIQTKELRLRPKTDENDFQTKLKKARKFLEKNCKVLVSVLFRGRERAHGDIARDHLQRMIKELEDIAKVESPPKMEGYRMTMVLAKK